MNEPIIRFEYRDLDKGKGIKATENIQETELEKAAKKAAENAKKIEEILRVENPKQYSEFYYLRSGKFESQLPTELEKNPQVKEAYQKLKDLYQKLNDKLRTFPGNLQEALDLIAEIDEYLLSELPELTSRITNRSLTELKNFAIEQKKELMESKITEVLAQRRTLLNEISDQDFDFKEPRPLNISFPDSLKEIGQARLELLKESGAWVKKLIETDLPTESETKPVTETLPEPEPTPPVDEVSQIPNTAEAINTPLLENEKAAETELSSEERQLIESYRVDLEKDREEISRVVTLLDSYMHQLRAINSRANLGDDNLNREFEEISALSSDKYKNLNSVLETMYSFHTSYLMKKMSFDRITNGKNIPQDLMFINQGLETNIKNTNTDDLKKLRRDIFSSWKINKNNKDRLRNLI